jgi:hypothetical protein
MKKYLVHKDEIQNFKKVMFINDSLVIKVFSEENTESLFFLGIQDDLIIKTVIEFSEENSITVNCPEKVEEVKNIYLKYLFILHEYSLRIDTITEDEKLVMDLLKNRIVFYSSTIKQLDLLTQLN